MVDVPFRDIAVNGLLTARLSEGVINIVGAADYWKVVGGYGDTCNNPILGATLALGKRACSKEHG